MQALWTFEKTARLLARYFGLGCLLGVVIGRAAFCFGEQAHRFVIAHVGRDRFSRDQIHGRGMARKQQAHVRTGC